LLLISRSKLVPDFAITLHFLHLIFTSLYSSSVPRNLLWWALQFASAGLMTSLGVYSCRWRELRPINFGSSTNVGGGGEGVQPAGGSEMNGDGDGDDLEQGYGRGRGRGKGRDGGGTYEMVGMSDKGDGGSG
jgi:hypothetical protein